MKYQNLKIFTLTTILCSGVIYLSSLALPNNSNEYQNIVFSKSNSRTYTHRNNNFLDFSKVNSHNSNVLYRSKSYNTNIAIADLKSISSSACNSHININTKTNNIIISKPTLTISNTNNIRNYSYAPRKSDLASNIAHNSLVQPFSDIPASSNVSTRALPGFNPEPTPLGDDLIILLSLLGVYIIIKIFR